MVCSSVKLGNKEVDDHKIVPWPKARLFTIYEVNWQSTIILQQEIFNFFKLKTIPGTH